MKSFYDQNGITRKHITRAIALSLVFSLLIMLSMFLTFQNKIEAVKADLNRTQNTSLNVMSVYIDDKFEAVFSDLQILRESLAVQNYVANMNNDFDKEDVIKLFYAYAEKKNALTQIRVLDEKGMERIRLNKSDTGIYIVGDDKLQDKQNRYYFTNSMALDADQLYISDFDLNIENGLIVIPYEPTIRFAMKLYDQSGADKGIIILNVDGLDFLKIINEYETKTEQYKELGVLDSNNFWSLNHQDENDYSKISLTILDNTSDEVSKILRNMGNIDSEGLLEFDEDNIHYSVKRIECKHDSHFVFEQENMFWYLVGFYDLDRIIIQYQFFLSNIIPITLLVSGIGGVLAYVILILYKMKERSKLALLTSAYISDNSHDGILIADSTKKIVYVNRVFEEIYGLTLGDLLGNEISAIFKGHLKLFKREIGDSILWDGNIWNESKHGNLICKHLTIKVVKDARNEVVYYIGIYSNPEGNGSYIIDVNNHEMNTFQLSEYEVNMVGDQITNGLSMPEHFVVMTMQLTGNSHKLFESNQMIHSQFLQMTQRDIHQASSFKVLAVPRTDLLVIGASVSSKELETFDDTKDELIQNVVDVIEKSLRKIQVSMGLKQLDFKFQVGIAINGIHGRGSNEVFLKSMIALEALIKMKKTNYLIYDEQYYEFVKEDLVLRKQLVDAFENNEFRVVYQPQFRISDNQIVGVEALVRWENDIVGDISPVRFIPLLEETDQILRLGQRVLDLVEADIETLEAKVPFRLSINLSGKEFVDYNVINQLIEKAKRINHKYVKFCFEITETALIENMELVNEFVNRCHEADIEIAIDDFGTGYSSLGYLKKISAKELKIDKIFIEDYPDNDDGKIIKAIISMGKELGFVIVAEGIETEEQLSLVRDNDCDIYQGYLGAKPMPIGQLDVLLKRQIEKKFLT